MQLIFERGDRSLPVGHALIYFTTDEGAVLATYVSVPPVAFDLSNYVPGFLQGAMQGLDLGDSMVAAPMPPIPEQVASREYLRSLAERRQDDLVFAGAASRGDPMRLAAETAEAARAYGNLYADSSTPHEEPPVPAAEEHHLFADMNEQERLNELVVLTGRLRDSVRDGKRDQSVETQIAQLADSLPPKYRAKELLDAALLPGDRGQKLAQLHLERCFKLFNEDYLDLERIDREIQSIAD